MRKLVTFLMTLLVGSSVSYVNADSSQVMFEAGYRRDNISWGFDAPSCNPLIEANTRFKDLDIFQIALSGRTHIGYNWYGRASVNWGWILDGDIENKTKLFTNVPGISGVGNFEFRNEDRNLVDGRFVVDLDIAVGYPFYFCDCAISFAPVVGYAFSEQNLRIEGDSDFGFSSASGLPVIASNGNCCDSKYVSRWFGPFVGLDFEYRACECMSVYAQLEYHWPEFTGKSHANHGFSLNDDSRRRARNGDGWLFKAGVDYDFSDCWTLGLNATFRDFKASRRHHACSDDFSALSGFASSVGSDERYRTHHRWHSYSVNVTVGRMF